jgi:transposase
MVPRAYSLDLRQRIVNAYEQGLGTIAEAADQFSVSTYFVRKMLCQWRETSNLAPLPHGGGKPASLAALQPQLLSRKVRQQSDTSLVVLQQLLSEQESVTVHLSTISRALTRLGLPRKKRA